MPLTREQVNAMAQEIVQHVKGDIRRAAEEQMKAAQDTKREARLVSEVAAKLSQALADAVEPLEEESGEQQPSPTPAPAAAPTTGSPTPPRR